jgi:hypothetical protein
MDRVVGDFRQDRIDRSNQKIDAEPNSECWWETGGG